jgi:hypothetical protein
MVTLFSILAQQQPLILRLSREDRLRALAGLALIIFLGVVLILFAWWAARATKRYIRRDTVPPTSYEKRSQPVPDDWASKPLNSSNPLRTDSDEY